MVSGVPTREAEQVLQQLRLPLPARWSSRFAHLPTVLVDFNDLEQAPGCLRNVVAVVDHHQESGDLAEVTERLIHPVGSTATMIAHRLLADHPADLDEQHCLLLLAAIISDTKSMLSPQTTAQDRQVVERLARQCGHSLEQMTFWLQELSCYQFAPELVPEYMAQSKKCITLADHLVCSAAIETTALKPFLPEQAAIASGLRHLGGDVSALIVTDLKHRQTAIFHIGCLPLPSPYVLDGICLRKREIRQLLEQHLSKERPQEGGAPDDYEGRSAVPPGRQR